MVDIDWNDHCEVCGSVIVAEGLAWSKKYCSQRCSTRALCERRKAATAAARADIKCVICGAPLKARRNDVKFCSGACRNAAWREYHRERLRDYQRTYMRERRAKAKLAPELAPNTQGLAGIKREKQVSSRRETPIELDA